MAPKIVLLVLLPTQNGKSFGQIDCTCLYVLVPSLCCYVKSSSQDLTLWKSEIGGSGIYSERGTVVQAGQSSARPPLTK